MNPALYLLIGAAATAVFSIVKDLLVEDRRDRNDRTRVWRQDLKEGRVACLLIGDELDSLVSHFQLLLKIERAPDTPIGESPFLSTREWHAHKAELATVIDKLDTWKALAAVHHNAEGVRTRIVSDPPATQMPPRMVEMVEQNAIDAGELAGLLYDASAALERQLLMESPSRFSLKHVYRAAGARAHRLRRGRQRPRDGGTSSSSTSTDDRPGS